MSSHAILSKRTSWIHHERPDVQGSHAKCEKLELGRIEWLEYVDIYSVFIYTIYHYSHLQTFCWLMIKTKFQLALNYTGYTLLSRCVNGQNQSSNWHGILYLVSSSCSRRFEKEFTFEILFMRRHRNLNINCVNRNLESKHISLSTKILWGNCCGCLPRNGAAEHRRQVQDDVFSLGEPRALSSRHVEQSFQEPAAGCKH